MYRTLRLCALTAALFIAVPLSPAVAADKDTYATLHGTEPALADGQGRVYFYRDSGFMGAAVQPLIYIDGTAGGRSKPGDYFYVDLPAGAHKVSTDTEKEETTDITVVAGETMFVKTKVTMGLFVGHVIPSVVDAAAAEGEIKDCDYHPLTPTPAPTPAPAPASPPAETPAAAPPATAATPATPTPTPAPDPAPASGTTH